jgi:hypothetical protein
MGIKESYFRRKAKDEAKRKRPFAERWWARLKSPDYYFQGLLVIFTLGLVVVGVLQWRTLDKSDATLKAAQRPWIEFDAKIIGPLEYIGEQLTILVQLGLKNSGHSPAINVRSMGTTRFFGDDLDLRHIQQQLCDSLNTVQGEWGATIFPNNTPRPHPMLFEISKDAIEKFKAKGAGHYTRPLLIGCVSYLDSADMARHDTGFVYILRSTLGPPYPSFELPKKAISAKELELVPWGSERIN